ncbi:phosphoribosyl-ATP pyrophosphohydrolase [Paenibacillus allorhizosphaerae]|uniref:Phosphoribosyl-ATP pyrophosphohydrolase n=1 Tax=Paenibacillus allorhizosphaerae TaxID=2849866 RepID=A0ABN7TKX6_9BACL|nr:hypothetical protein PAECIP111802_01975 [Paenibacillus allorhizosphaerae]
MITNYNKLIRDRIPEIIEAKGKRAVVRTLNEREYIEMLDKKLQEELDEYTSAEAVDQVEELADLVELVYAVLHSRGVSVEEFEKIRLKKKAERGGFEQKLYLIHVEET